MEGFGAVFQGLDWMLLVGMLLSVVPILLCLTVHELSHGLMAYAFGDDTAKRLGRLSLNPIRHIDFVGFLMLLFVRFGWAKPVPVDMRNFDRPRLAMAMTALAGPLSNFLFAALILIFQIPLRGMLASGGWAGQIATIFLITAIINVNLGVFNLLPIPPLDGSKILFSVLPKSAYNLVLRYERYGMILLMAVVWLGLLAGPLHSIMNGAVSFLFDLTYGLSAFFFA